MAYRLGCLGGREVGWVVCLVELPLKTSQEEICIYIYNATFVTPAFTNIWQFFLVSNMKFLG